MEGLTTTITFRKKREITQKEMDDLLCLCEEFFWIDHFDKLVIKEN
ncbi:MAG: hypothetical protein ACFFA0_03285 [Promethearchaeota archaeon]